MTTIVVKLGGAVAGDSATTIFTLARRHRVCVVHGAGPQISAEMTSLGIPVEFVDGRRVTSAEALEVVRRSASSRTSRTDPAGSSSTSGWARGAPAT